MMLIQQKKTWWRNIIRCFATTSLPYVLRYADDGSTHVTERHRHRYEVNVAYKDRLREGGLRISGQSPDGELTEFVELPQDVHPFYVATQAHPEFKSRPTKPHPLFAGLVKAALDHQAAR